MNERPLVVHVQLKQEVSYVKKGVNIQIDVNSILFVDADTHIGLYNGDHIQLDEADYSVLYTN